MPSIYLQPYSNPMFSMQKKLHSSNLNLSTLSTVLSHPTKKSQFHKSHSMEVLSEPPSHSTPVQRNEFDRCESSFSGDTDFCSSSSVYQGLSLDSSEGEENPRQSEDDAGSPDSALCIELQSPTNSETSSPCKQYPQVPPRPQPQEILTRCTTYTRKAALETQARLLSDREVLES